MKTLTLATILATAILGCAWLTATVSMPTPRDAWMTPGQTGVTTIVMFAVWALIAAAADVLRQAVIRLIGLGSGTAPCEVGNVFADRDIWMRRV